jgi:hypothetical protein
VRTQIKVVRPRRHPVLVGFGILLAVLGLSYLAYRTVPFIEGNVNRVLYPNCMSYGPPASLEKADWDYVPANYLAEAIGLGQVGQYTAPRWGTHLVVIAHRELGEDWTIERRFIYPWTFGAGRYIDQGLDSRLASHVGFVLAQRCAPREIEKVDQMMERLGTYDMLMDRLHGIP